jgi:hypothetical protein
VIVPIASVEIAMNSIDPSFTLIPRPEFYEDDANASNSSFSFI